MMYDIPITISDKDRPRIGVNIERTNKGYNFGASVTNAKSVIEAISLLREAMIELREATKEYELIGRR